MNELSFTIYGRPQPQGSTRIVPVGPRENRRNVLTSDNKKLRSWRQDIAVMAVSARNTSKWQLALRPLAVAIFVDFYFARPGSLSKRIVANTKQPDMDKLLRALNDALTGICFEDDAQVNQLFARKCYGSPERTEVKVWAGLPLQPPDELLLAFDTTDRLRTQ